MQNQKSNSRTNKSSSAAGKNKSTAVATTDPKPAELVKEQEAEKGFDTLMDHYRKMELLRDRYNRLKIKRDSVRAQLAEMELAAKELQNDFVGDEGAEDKKFHFSIKLTNEDDHRVGVISKMNKPEVVIPFTRLLLKEINTILESFQADIVAESKRLK